MLRSLKKSSEKSSIFDDFRVVLILLLGVALALLYWAPRFKLDALMTGLFSKNNQGIILNYFLMSPEGVSKFLGEPFAEEALREGEQLLYWDFDPVTVEIHFYKNKASRIAYATSSTTIRDHVEDRIREVYGDEMNWKQESRKVDEVDKMVYANPRSKMTLVKYEGSAMVYNYLFPEPRGVKQQ